MKFQFLFCYFWSIVTFALWPLAFVGEANAQDISALVDSRVKVDADLESGLPAGEEAVRRGGLELGAQMSAAYNDNIFLSRRQAEADGVYKISPSISYTHGDSKTDGAGGFIQASYRPTVVVYGQHADANRVDQEAQVSAGWAGNKSSVGYKGSVQKLGEATADVGRQTDRVQFENELRGAWKPREKVTLQAAVGNRQTRYNDPTLIDSSKTYGELGVKYALSPKTELGIAYQAGNFQVERASRQTTHQVLGSIVWQPREKIQLQLKAGGEQRKSEATTSVRPVLEARIDWTPRKGTSLYLSGYQREEASAFFAGQNYRVKGVTAGFSQRLGGNWTARADLGYETANYNQVDAVRSNAVSGRNDRQWFLRPSLDYKLTDEFSASLFYRVGRNTSTASDFGYNQNLIGVEVNYEF